MSCLKLPGFRRLPCFTGMSRDRHVFGHGSTTTPRATAACRLLACITALPLRNPKPSSRSKGWRRGGRGRRRRRRSRVCPLRRWLKKQYSPVLRIRIRYYHAFGVCTYDNNNIACVRNDGCGAPECFVVAPLSSLALQVALLPTRHTPGGGGFFSRATKTLGMTQVARRATSRASCLLRHSVLFHPPQRACGAGRLIPYWCASTRVQSARTLVVVTNNESGPFRTAVPFQERTTYNLGRLS